MKITEFLANIEQNCSQITFLSMQHLYSKVYNDIQNDEDSFENIIQNIVDYNLMMRYLNDYCGTIYRRYNSSTQEIYDELCNYLKLDDDNEYTYNYILKKLKKQTPALIMSLSDEDIQQQTIANFIEKLDNLKKSNYFMQNKISLQADIEQLENNISLVKKALNIQ